MRFIIFFIVLVLLRPAFAQISPAQIEQLSQNPKWLSLLHYRPHGFMETSYSEVDDDAFFLHQDGKYNAAKELAANIDQFSNENNQVLSDSSASCRFPERRYFIASQLPQLNLQPVKCPKYDEWRKDIHGDVLHLIFPSSYINSPSSMFGHTLFRLDGKQGHKLLSSAINFAAFTDPTDDEITFTYKGLTGGYPGYVSLVPYYEKVNEYSHMESRDIWEYELKLSQEEVDSFIRHIWELDQIRFDYFFIDENCSYRLLTILDAVNPQWRLSETFDSRTVPTDTIRALRARNLIANIEFRPSKTTNIEHQRLQLTHDMRELSRALSDNPYDQELQTRLSIYNEKQQAQMLELGYHYTRYLVTKKKESDPDIPKRSLKLLSLRSKVDFNQEAFTKVIEPVYRDDQGHGTYRYLFGLSRFQDKDYLEAGFRINYHDWLDNLPGYREGAQIEMGNVIFHGREDELKLKQFDVLHIRSLGPRNLFSHPISWQVQGGYERQPLMDDHWYVRVGGGASYEFLSGLIYSMGVVELSAIERDKNWFRMSAGPEIGWLKQNDLFNSFIKARWLYGVDDEEENLQAEIGMSISVSRDQQIRLLYQYQQYAMDNLQEDHDSLQIRYVLYQ
ncbi:DUF4105 domain-containing protein [Bermanella marisrubri]|uniref:Uncharacterized protein n=1 Tax=Bermanella marisrubri TaxID=207949 RepID=Q1N048_9GAMM|nr:DUF4105 domain-containing protein [Bermanella marisrubri]EAT11669.1 hypothetical protein RED65_08269 [Oceanobacter sp. RED65] [Bermanella marisrubri]QIZ83294.1 DUF4105 domain-containing protein [Bermanella marisrubri]